MEVFTSTCNQMILMFLFILLGFFLNKKKLLPDNANAVLSKLENMVFMPCLVLNTFISRCTIENLTTKLPFFLYSALSLAIVAPLAVLLSRFFATNKDEEGIYRYSLMFSNIAFMGNAVVEGIFGDDVLFDYLIFTLILNVAINSVGISWLMPVKDGKPFYKKLLNPINVATIVGILLGITGIPLPKAFLNFISTGSACMSPVAMLLTGFVIGGYELKHLITMKKVYLLSIYRLICMPLLFYFITLMVPVDMEIKRVLICAYAMPLGLNTIVIPAAYEGDTSLGASMALVSNIMALITIPLIFSISFH